MASSTSIDIFVDETALIERRDLGDFDVVRIGDYPNITVTLYLGHSDEVVANSVDRLIEALNEVRSAALERIVKNAA